MKRKAILLVGVISLLVIVSFGASTMMTDYTSFTPTISEEGENKYQITYQKSSSTCEDGTVDQTYHGNNRNMYVTNQVDSGVMQETVNLDTTTVHGDVRAWDCNSMTVNLESGQTYSILVETKNGNVHHVTDFEA